MKKAKRTALISVLFSFLIAAFAFTTSYADTVYNFTSDTVGSPAANTTTTNGTLLVSTNATLGGNALHATAGTQPTLTFNNFTSAADYSVTWKEAHNSTGGRHSFLLRGQVGSTSTFATGVQQGYMFQVNLAGGGGSANTVKIFNNAATTITSLGQANFTVATLQYFKATVSGSTLTLSASTDGTVYTQLLSVTDTTYTTGDTQYTAGYGSALNNDYMDDITQSIGADVTPPVISNITTTSISSTSAVVSWTTDEAATTKVLYGKTTSYGQNETFHATSLGTSHSVTLTGLTPNTAYHFEVNSMDAAANSATSSDNTFTTTTGTAQVITSNIASFWKMNETSGTRTDSAGTSPLAEQGGTVSSASGKVGSAASFSGSNYLSVADNASLSNGDNDFTVAGWVNLTNKSALKGIAMKWDSTSNIREYGIYYDNTVDRFIFSVSSDGTGPNTVKINADTLGSPSLNTWYYVVGWHDSVNNTVNIEVNNTGIDSGTWSNGAFDGTATFYVGAWNTGTQGVQSSGSRIDALGMWKTVLSVDNLTQLYNAGNGLEYPFSLNDITVTSPKQYQVFQRNGSNTATINITGTYTGSPTAIEASWNGGSYTTIVASPTGGTYSGTLANMTGGQGTLNVRFVNDTSAAVSVPFVGVGDIFVIAGQSNASGRGFNNQSYATSGPKAVLFANNDTWEDMTDPTDSSAGQIDAVSADDIAAGSVWPLLATYILADQSVPVAFIPASKGGVSITTWQRNLSTSTLYGSMARRITAAGGSIKAVLYFQGEADADTSMSTATYLGYLNSMADSIASDFGGAKTVVGMIGNSDHTDDQLNNIRAAEISSWNTSANILTGPITMDVNLADEGADNLHFKSDGDLAVFAQRWWAPMKVTLYGGTDDGRGPRLQSVTYNAAKTALLVNFTDSTPLGSGTVSASVFTVKSNGTPVTISSVTRMSGTTLRLNLASAASGTLTVSLASGQNGATGTMPKDTSTFTLPAEPFFDAVTTLADVPGAPTSLTVTATGNGQATISFAGPVSNGGSTITGYTVTSIPGGGTDLNAGTTALVHVVTGLTNGQSYTFTATATNAMGTGSASSPSASATPTAPVGTPAPSTPPQQGYISGGSSNTTFNPGAQAPACAPGDRFNTATGLPCPVSTTTTTTTTTTSPSSTQFTLNLYSGVKNIQVFWLQEYLNAHGFAVAITGAGSPGHETALFGPATKAALSRFQKAHGISPTNGYFGPITRAFIAQQG